MFLLVSRSVPTLHRRLSICFGVHILWLHGRIWQNQMNPGDPTRMLIVCRHWCGMYVRVVACCNHFPNKNQMQKPPTKVNASPGVRPTKLLRFTFAVLLLRRRGAFRAFHDLARLLILFYISCVDVTESTPGNTFDLGDFGTASRCGTSLYSRPDLLKMWISSLARGNRDMFSGGLQLSGGWKLIE